MPFGKIIETSAPISGMPAQGPRVFLDLLCDGGTRPNPGTSQPVVHDGLMFLAVPSQTPGTNHKAI